MLRVLTLSTLFPNAVQPTLGIFVERQTLGLAALPDVELEVVSSTALPVWPLSLHSNYAARARLPRRECWKGLEVHRPHHRLWPRLADAAQAHAMANALLPLLREIRRRWRFDVIDAEFFWPDGVAAMHLSQALDVPFSVKARGADINYWAHRPGIGEQIVAAGAAAGGLLAVSDAMKAAMAAAGLPEDKIRTHYTGVDFDRFQPLDRQEAKAKLGLAGPVLVTPGALIPRKAQHLAIGALTELPEATLLIVGDGPDRDRLERLAQRLGVDGRVRFMGNRPHEELPSLLAAADAMVLTSTSEGLANVWVEALACGTPIVITDIGGAREVVREESAGRIIAPAPDAVAGAVRTLLDRPPPPRAVRRAAERFTWEANAAALRDHLARIAS